MARLDIVIFGATGFTGRKAVEEAVRLSQNKAYTFTWGIAGRSESKLNALLKEIQDKTGQDLSKIRTIVADVSDYESIKLMCKEAKVIANCCGPYRFYGEPVIRGCLEMRTSQVDVCGEPQYIESMLLKYGEDAQKAGIYIVSACGFDSIPNDLGVLFLQKNFNGTVNSIESRLTVKGPKVANSAVINYGTWESLIHGIAHSNELKELRHKIQKKLPPLTPKLEPRSALHKLDGKWWVPFLGADASVVHRSQHARWAAAQGDLGRGRPAQFRPYVAVGRSLCRALLAVAAAVALFALASFQWSRKLLLDHPNFFSFGLISREGPTEEAMQNTKFRVTLYAEGWDQDTDTSGPINKKMAAQVSGVNPGYGMTVTGLLLSALTIVNHSDRMPDKGGVLSTAAAFTDTDLIEQLQRNNVEFEVLKE